MIFIAKSTPWWIAIVVALIGLGGTIGGVFLKDWLDRRKEKRSNVMGTYFSQSHRVYQQIGTMRRKLCANRALIIRAENGGGKPKPGSQIYISVVFESADSAIEDSRDQFQKYPADGSYMELLSDVYEDDYVLLVTEDMPEGFLRTYYEAQGIVQSEVIKLYADDTRFVYMSLNYATPKVPEKAVDTTTPKHKAVLDGGVHMLKQLFNETKELSES